MKKIKYVIPIVLLSLFLAGCTNGGTSKTDKTDEKTGTEVVTSVTSSPEVIQAVTATKSGTSKELDDIDKSVNELSNEDSATDAELEDVN